MDVEGKAALITGGGTGVGRATALALARRGCAVAVNYSRSRDEAEQTAADAIALGVRAVALVADVADATQAGTLVARAVAELDAPLAVLVNSAGTTSFIPHGDLERVGDDDWDRILAVNLKGPFHCARAARSALEAAGGEIVNVSSIAGLAGIGSSIPYCASKAALNNLTITLARALAPRIRVNAVAPGFITGRWLEGGLGAAYEATKAFVEQRVPLHRVCEPEDVAAAIVGLVTGSDLVTGQILTIDGGMLIAGLG